MKNQAQNLYDTLFIRYPALAPNRESILKAFDILCDTYKRDGKVLCCGNGGSCADSEHIVGELMKSFLFKRKIDEKVLENLAGDSVYGAELAANLEGALPAISLCGHSALSTAYLNDTNPMLTFAQQVYGFGRPGDTLIAITTSGNSKNCLYAAAAAKARGMSVIALTGENGGKIRTLSDVCIAAPERETYKIQEYHLPVYHALCAMLEAEFFSCN